MNGRRWCTGRLLAGVAVAVVMTVTGCGGGDDKGDGGGNNEVASVDKKEAAGQQAKDAKTELEQYIEDQRTWVACMRENRIDMPDPDAKGNIDVARMGDFQSLKGDAKYLRASEKCDSLRVDVPQSVEKAMQPKPSKEEIDKKKRYAKCMQENGAPDFPDADDEGYYEEVAWDAEAAGAKRATAACRSIIGDPDPGTVQPKG
ncbi:hypothetical protein [Streptomyces yaizuensis]|uniref:Lipoprotein n=1 Tax=Streptomyces yaizuensis TaxID=2989713 RepID=A0ABQ5P3S5_9ACTN|nr:hypothetical protein [Streptomyces sp. YSPA8]GLF97246.1 hypothetical protein SYYSPA8_23135 [Streptomyces sp. YSPA8]